MIQGHRAAAYRTLMILLCLFALGGCTRTVTWEEEVPLNTGETIWVERRMPWEMLGGYGNPFDISMQPTREQTIRFTYGRKDYVYVGRANVLWLAISPERTPVLVAPAADYGWYSENSYYCVIPYYVQLVPDQSGKQWTWPEAIEPWLYQMPANLMASIPQLREQRNSKYTKKDRDERDAVYRHQFPRAVASTRNTRPAAALDAP